MTQTKQLMGHFYCKSFFVLSLLLRSNKTDCYKITLKSVCEVKTQQAGMYEIHHLSSLFLARRDACASHLDTTKNKNKRLEKSLTRPGPCHNCFKFTETRYISISLVRIILLYIVTFVAGRHSVKANWSTCCVG